MKVEIKSIIDGSGVRLSSIDGWTTAQVPKVLAVVQCTKRKMRPIRRPDGRQTKARDIEVRIDAYYLYYIQDIAAELFVPWPGTSTLRQITSTRWQDHPTFLDEIRAIAKRANQASSAPIKLQAEKNGEFCRLHYVCRDHHRLPPCPLDIRKILEPPLQRMVGAKLRLWKDHSAYGGPVGYVDEAMLRWEDEHQRKATGRLEVVLASGDVLTFPDFNQGRQDYWGGFAIEVVLESLADNLRRTAGGAVGADLTVDDLLMSNARAAVPNLVLREVAHKEGKHGLLRRIQALLGITPNPRDVSRGGTVTRSALSEIAERVGAITAFAGVDTSTKAACIRTSLTALGAAFEPTDVSTGGTVTSYALLKILLGLDERIATVTPRSL